LNFDYTYIILFGAKIFEPVTILTNGFIGAYCIYSFLKINKYKNKLATEWAYFFLLIGVSSTVGSVAHGTHHQLGNLFLNTAVFLMNATSLLSIYFCFKAANTTLFLNKKQPNKYITYFVMLWVATLLVITFINNNFLLIKIHAGIVLTYSLIIHLLTHAKKQQGSVWIAFGILVSFISIVIHSLKLSISDWFNHKDISHVIVLVSIVFMVKGVLLKSQNLKTSLR